jgi:hypothetical protein
LAIHAAKRVRNGAFVWLTEHRPDITCLNIEGGQVIGLVYVTGCRPLVPSDEQGACFYALGLFAWTLEHARRFKTPIVMRGPQKIVYLDRNRVEEALGNG